MATKKKPATKKSAGEPAAKKSASPNAAAEVKALRAAVQELVKAGRALIKVTGGKARALRSLPAVIAAVQSMSNAADNIKRQLTPPTTTIQSGS